MEGETSYVVNSCTNSSAPVVTRSYSPAPSNCAHALELLLKKPVSKKSAETSGDEDHARKENNDSRAKGIVPGNS
jgi:hypothetical protein